MVQGADIAIVHVYSTVHVSTGARDREIGGEARKRGSGTEVKWQLISGIGQIRRLPTEPATTASHRYYAEQRGLDKLKFRVGSLTRVASIKFSAQVSGPAPLAARRLTHWPVKITRGRAGERNYRLRHKRGSPISARHVKTDQEFPVPGSLGSF